MYWINMNLYWIVPSVIAIISIIVNVYLTKKNTNIKNEIKEIQDNFHVTNEIVYNNDTKLNNLSNQLIVLIDHAEKNIKKEMLQHIIKSINHINDLFNCFYDINKIAHKLIIYNSKNDKYNNIKSLTNIKNGIKSLESYNIGLNDILKVYDDTNIYNNIKNGNQKL